MPRTLLLLALPFLLVILIAACGDDDTDSGGSTTPGLTSESGDPSATESDIGESETPIDTGEQGKTPGPDESPGETQPPETAPGDVPTPGPTSSEGTPAIEPADVNAFVAQFDGRESDFAACAYNPSTALTNCGSHGLFAIDPPIVGQDVDCQLWLVEGVAEAVLCRSVDPLQSRYYDIQ